MNLVVDIGNTFVKACIVEQGEIKKNFVFRELDSNKIEEFGFNSFDGIIISSVREDNRKSVELLETQTANFVFLDENTKLPFKNQYETPKTLGKDRIAAVAGAQCMFRNRHCLIIDAGTAITFELLNKEGMYVGGNISPGLEMRFKALSHFTQKLPLEAKTDEFNLIGANTSKAIIAGVQNAMIFEIEGYIDRLEKNYNPLSVVITGGDCFFFEKKLKKTIFVEPNLVALGLNRILEHNA